MTIHIDTHQTKGSPSRKAVPVIVGLLIGVVVSGMLGIKTAADRALDYRFSGPPPTPITSPNTEAVNVRLRYKTPAVSAAPTLPERSSAKPRTSDQALAPVSAQTPPPASEPLLQLTTSTKPKPNKNLRKAIGAPVEALLAPQLKRDNSNASKNDARPQNNDRVERSA